MKERQTRIGFAYDKPVKQINTDKPESVESEYEDECTISWIRSTLQELGPVIDLPWGTDIVSKVACADLDIIFNITEARCGRNRESLIPALAEASGIPCTGSDAVGLGISLDKYLTKALIQHLSVPTPGSVKIDSIHEWDKLKPRLSKLRFPVIAKPNTGGSSMGIRSASRCESLSELYNIAKWLLGNFSDDVLVEEFVSGREFTVGLLARPLSGRRARGSSFWKNLEQKGKRRKIQKLEILPIAEILIKDGSPKDFYSYERKSKHEKELICPADLPDGLADLMSYHACQIFGALGCRDLARVDFRVGIDDGIPYFLEINPLPGLSPYYSIFPIQAQAAGISPENIIHQLIHNAMNRNS